MSTLWLCKIKHRWQPFRTLHTIMPIGTERCARCGIGRYYCPHGGIEGGYTAAEMAAIVRADMMLEIAEGCGPGHAVTHGCAQSSRRSRDLI